MDRQTDKSASIHALEDNIEAFIREVRVEMLERVGQNWNKRMIHLRSSRSQTLNYMGCTIDSNKYFINFFEFNVFFFLKNFLINKIAMKSFLKICRSKLTLNCRSRYISSVRS